MPIVLYFKIFVLLLIVQKSTHLFLHILTRYVSKYYLSILRSERYLFLLAFLFFITSYLDPSSVFLGHFIFLLHRFWVSFRVFISAYNIDEFLHVALFSIRAFAILITNILSSRSDNCNISDRSDACFVSSDYIFCL